MRVYQGTLKRGDFVTFGAQRSKLKVTNTPAALFVSRLTVLA